MQAARRTIQASSEERESVGGDQPRRRGRAPSPRESEGPDAPGPCLEPDEVLGVCAGSLEPAAARAAQRHLDLCPVCMDLVALALGGWTTAEPADPIELGANFRAGDRVGHHLVQRFLARGGMGEVYEAIDGRTGARVALKAVLASACDNRHFLLRFRREAALARRVHHPNVCRVRDVPGPDALAASPVPYFTLDLVEGETLAQRLQRGNLRSPEALPIARQLLRGLGAIHAAGVLHLDIKASNIMLRAASGAPVIVDFGLARLAHGSPGRGRPLTGSVPYMPPEQIRGAPPGPGNDVFAFGVVLFQMLTGTLPFPSAEPSVPSSIVQRLAARAAPPSRLSPGVPAWLDRVVLACLAEPARRFPTTAAVLRALEREDG